MELAIDTSTRVAGLALSNKGALIAEITWYAGQNHTVELVPNMMSLLEQRKAHIRDIESIVVAKGPGSFNGLRVALATAKGLVFALGIHLVGISTLEVMAFPYADLGFPVCPILYAGRSEIATALFQTRDGRWERLTVEHTTTIDDLCSRIGQPTIFCGEISDEGWMQLEQRLGKKALIVKGSAVLRRAGYLAELGWQRIESGDFDDPFTLQPLYLKRPAITVSKKEEV
ncbi:tRNA (adenosine(37)-N6)-threonylcarbamoyltransferase complex dimerization subunit type 1 TsaB [Dehalococcoidia bacterium]|nr:tRNA (adenosine(37)-N6)-threonylcarbamoyltransferase complex dimerization subunit type 1 TsaB [Dehalococcoidia bacterium]